MILTPRAARLALLASAASLLLTPAALAQQGTPPLPMHGPSPNERAIAAPADVAYPGGTIILRVDATDLERKIFTVKETIPVAQAGPMTLLFPLWIPGHHSPTGPIKQLAGLVITAGGKRVEWIRDPLNVEAYHVVVPAGAKSLELEFQHLVPFQSSQGAIKITPEMLNLKWDEMILYPAGYYARRIPVEASVKLPTGWKFATALDRSGSFETPTFKPAPLDILIDSPIYAGKYFKRVDLDPGSKVPVHLNIVADNEEELEAKPEYIEAHKKLIQQAYKVFDSHHYDHYEFLLSISDKMSGQGLEHHRSSENGVGTGYFSDWDKDYAGRDLLAHEYTHSWDGKFRRGADLWTPNYSTPMRDSLLWVYEGQTQYWGVVLAARSGLWSKQQALDALATDAVQYDYTVGRSWRAMIDTTNDPTIAQRRPIGWRSWQRSEDYYVEGQLMWMEADALIRQQTGGKKSLDDFAKAFFGPYNGSFTEYTYTFEDVVKTLNGVSPYDWTKFLNDHLYGHGPGAPLKWIEMDGYKLVWTEKPTDLEQVGAGEEQVHRP